MDNKLDEKLESKNNEMVDSIEKSKTQESSIANLEELNRSIDKSDIKEVNNIATNEDINRKSNSLILFAINALISLPVIKILVLMSIIVIMIPITIITFETSSIFIEGMAVSLGVILATIISNIIPILIITSPKILDKKTFDNKFYCQLLFVEIFIIFTIYSIYTAI